MTSKKLTPMQAIKQYCKKNCCCGDLVSWKDCTVKNCPLWHLRTGKRPKPLPFHYYTKKHADLPLNFQNKGPSIIGQGLKYG